MILIDGKPGELIVINNDVTIKILENSNGQLNLEIGTPKGMKVVKGEEDEKNIK